MPITFGVHTGQQNCELQELVRLWQYVDRSGFDWISVWDHFEESPPIDRNGSCFEAVSAMTLLAAQTRHVRVGCLVFCINYRHPAVLANALCAIDHVSGGRMECGIGAGWHEAEYRGYGIPFEPIRIREDQLEEGVQVIRLLFTQEVSNFKGQHYQLSDARCNPKPIQKWPRIWVGGLGEKRTLRTVARYADGWNAPYISPGAFGRKSQVVDDWCAREGRDPKAILRTVNVGFYMGADEAAAKRKRDALAAEWGAMLPDRIKGFLVGTSREARDRVGEYERSGAARLSIALRAPFDWEALQAFVEEVMPAFGAKASG